MLTRCRCRRGGALRWLGSVASIVAAIMTAIVTSIMTSIRTSLMRRLTTVAGLIIMPWLA